MSQTELNVAIENAFQLLAGKSWELFDAWYEVLHDVPAGSYDKIGAEIKSEWNETNLNLMLQGVAPAA